MGLASALFFPVLQTFPYNRCHFLLCVVEFPHKLRVSGNYLGWKSFFWSQIFHFLFCWFG